MEINKLCIALGCTLSANTAERKQAETFLYESQKSEGYLKFLLQLIFDPPEGLEVIDHVKQAGIIQFKNIIKDHWDIPDYRREYLDEKDLWTLPVNDKQFLLLNIFPFLCKSTNKNIMVQLEEAIEIIGNVEFPDNWPNIITQITEALQTQDEMLLYAGLCTTFRLVKLYRFEVGKLREPLTLLVQNLFPLLLQIMSKLISVPLTEQSATLIREILKSFLATFQITIPPELAAVDVFMIFYKHLITVLEMELPPELLAKTVVDSEIMNRKKSIFWMTKREAIEILYRISHKYGDPKYAESSTKEFSHMIKDKYIGNILEMATKIVKASRDNFIEYTTLNYAIKCLIQGVKNPNTIEIIYPAIPELLTEYIFPQLFVTEANALLWDENPEEFTRQQFDIAEVYLTPRQAGIEMIEHVCTHTDLKGVTTDFHPFLSPLMQFLAKTLVQSLQPGTNTDLRVLDATMFAIGNVSKQIFVYDSLINSVESMLTTYIAPLLKHPIGFIRMRAVWLFDQFHGMRIKDLPALKVTINSIYQLMSDEELPVRVMAANTLHKFLEVKEVPDWLKPELSNLLKLYLKIINELELEELVAGLETFVRIYDEEIKPFAEDLTRELVGQFHKMTSQGEEAIDSIMASSACVDAIGRIMYAVGKNNEYITKTEEMVFPIILFALSPKGVDLVDSCMDILSTITYFTPSISPRLWELYPILIDTVAGSVEEEATNAVTRDEGGWGFEYLNSFVVVFQNYMAKNPALFLEAKSTKGNYAQMMFRLISRILFISKKKHAEMDTIFGVKLLITLLEAFKGLIPNFLPDIIKLLIEELNLAKTDNLRSVAMQGLCMALWHDAMFTLTHFEANGWTQPVFKSLFNMIDNFSFDFEFRRFLFGVTSILAIPNENLPQMVQTGISHILTKTIEIIGKDIEDREEDSDSDSDAGGSDEDDMGDEEYHNLLRKLHDKNVEDEEKLKKGVPVEDDDSVDDEDYKDEAADKDLYASPLDDIDELMFFREMLQNMMTNEGPRYELLMNSISTESKDKLRIYMEKALELYNKEQAVKTKEK